MDYIRYIAEIATQKNFAAHHGQPARIEAWLDPSIDDRFGGCYSSTLKTMQSTWIRPRYPGYWRFKRPLDNSSNFIFEERCESQNSWTNC